MADKLRTITFEGTDRMNSLNVELRAFTWAIRSSINSSSQHSPAQLVQTTINQESIKSGKKTLALEKNKRENKTKVSHTYNVGDKVLITTYKRGVRRKLSQPKEE